jgi:hypothetical protein
LARTAAAEYRHAPPRRKRGGLAAACSAIGLVCALALAPASFGATGPTPDPVPNPQPDAAPVPESQSSPTRQQPAAQVPSGTLAPTPSQQPASSAAPNIAPRSTARSSVRTNRARAKARARAGAKARARAARAKARRARRLRIAAALTESTPGQARAAAAQHPRTAVIAARRMANMLKVDRQRASSESTLSNGELFAAGTLLLLFVGAAASVLRLTVRMSGEASAGRLLRS